MLFFFLKIIVIVVTIALIGAVARTWQMEHSENQKLFLAGTPPAPPPDGLYHGSVTGYTGSWQGKKFDAAHTRGINIFRQNSASTTEERYPFTTSFGPGIRDNTLTVMKIDYNIAGNPWWLRPILDEIVQTAPDTYVGKLHVRLIPRYPVTLGFFELKK